MWNSQRRGLHLYKKSLVFEKISERWVYGRTGVLYFGAC